MRTRFLILLSGLALFSLGFAACGDDDRPQGDAAVDGADDAGTPEDAGDDVSARAPTCASYCGALSTSCTGENAQYADEAACISHCAAVGWPAGITGATDGNSIACRQYHAGVAGEMMAEVHCDHAGPSGGAVCSSWCENYCDLAMNSCTGANVLFADRAGCLNTCAGYREDGEPGDMDGDSVQCRIYHLGTPANDDPAMHCPHGAPDGGDVCVSPIGGPPTCEAYCAAVVSSCVGENVQYTDRVECEAFCNGAGWDPGTLADISGNTVGCRLYHAGVAEMGDSATRCPHAGPSGAGICGTECENYCHLARTQCTGENQLFSDEAECMTACDAFDNSGSPGDVDGDSLQCRLYHAGVPASADPRVHCEHASVDGGAVCVTPPPTCESYCTAVTASCEGDNAQYADEAQCLSYCQSIGLIPAGASENTAGNTLGCRIYHAGLASTMDAAVHCEHAGPSGGTLCGSLCENYCHLMVNHCPESISGRTLCEMDCDDFVPLTGNIGDSSGDTVQCRMHYAALGRADVAQCASAEILADMNCVD